MGKGRRGKVGAMGVERGGGGGGGGEGGGGARGPYQHMPLETHASGKTPPPEQLAPQRQTPPKLA